MLLHFAEEEVFDLSESLGSIWLIQRMMKLSVYGIFAPQRNVEFEVFVFHQEAQANQTC